MNARAHSPSSSESAALKRIIEVYFSDPARTLQVSAGTAVIRQDHFNDRLFWVVEGSFTGYIEDENAKLKAQVFKVEQGMFFGVHSYFARRQLSSSTIIADQDCVVTWVDLDTQAVDEANYGSLNEQFMPVVVNELAQRQIRTGLQAVEKQKALQKLHTMEQMTTLGQLAAGIAHELNNAVGVIASKNDCLQQAFYQFLEQNRRDLLPFVDIGITSGQGASSSEVRQRGKALESKYKLDRTTAKQLARAVPEGEIPDYWLANLDEALEYWDVGRDLHDMRVAAKHAASIVRSVKQLGGADQERVDGVDVNDTIHKSLSLLQSNLRQVNVSLRPAQLPPINASTTELVQVWVNIIKNACDAMENTDNPQIEIVTSASANRVRVTISNNGPMIDEATRRKVFQPNFTTKKGGLSFGLGLGLSIVKRIVHSYGGSITLKSEPQQTVFRIKLPIT